ncbi:Isocitrate dehydrogenase [NADP] [compost metagenome]
MSLYWAEALAAQDEDAELKAKFASLAKTLAQEEPKIVAELAQVQGKPADIGGYYAIDKAKVDAVMRPSATFNAVLATVNA